MSKQKPQMASISPVVAFEGDIKQNREKSISTLGPTRKRLAHLTRNVKNWAVH